MEDDSQQLSEYMLPHYSGNGIKAQPHPVREELERICRLKVTGGEKTMDVTVYVYRDHVLIIRNGTMDSQVFPLTDPGHTAALRAALLDGIILPEQGCGDGPALLMSRAEYMEIKKQAAGSMLNLCRYVKKVTGDLRLSVHFANGVKFPCSSGELKICSRNAGGWERHYASFTGNRTCGWLLRMSVGAEEDWVSAVPVDKEQFCSIFLKWLLHLPPAGNQDAG